MKKSTKIKYGIIIAVILMIIVLIKVNPFSKSETVISENLAGEENIASLSTFAVGKGTSEEPYEISTKEEMYLLAELVNSYAEDTVNGGYYTKKYYKLTQDIDLENSEWIPIGTKTDMETTTTNKNNYTFQGNFNGNGHIVRNIKITLDSMPAYKAKYGLFGALYSTSSSDRAMVYNLEVVNMNLTVTAKTESNVDLMIGVIAGHIGKNSSIINCIARNSTITVKKGFSIKSEKLLAIGGIVGDTAGDSTTDAPSYTEVKGSSMYAIENCFSDVDIKIDDDSWIENEIKDEDGNVTKNSTYYQYNVGGIIGRIRYQAKFPENCVYTGTIDATKAFIGPIYGCARYNTTNSGDTYYDYTYAGLNSSKQSIATLTNGYFYNYKVGSTSIGQDYKDGLNGLNPVTTGGNITVYTLRNNLYAKSARCK